MYLGLALAMALAACVHQSPSDLPQLIAAKCQTPVSWVEVGDNGRPIVKPPRDADYKKVDCILGELRPDLTGITFIGNEAFPSDHPVEKARRHCKATNVMYDDSGSALVIKFGGPVSNPEELSRQASCMQTELAGTSFRVEMPAR